MRGIRAVRRNGERTQECQRQARHLLMELDPIGVSDTPEATGEYDCMIGPLLHRLSRGTASITPPHHPFRRRRDCAGQRRPGVRRGRARHFRQSAAAGTRTHWRHRSGRDPHRDRRRQARWEDHSDRACGCGPRRSRRPCRWTRNAAAPDGARLKLAAAARLRGGCRSRPDLPVGSCRRGCRPKRQPRRRPAREGLTASREPGENAGMVDLSTADDLAAC